ncbi:MAG: GxxExxY protein [Planctomycetaceae bacterium]|nr:GxxExxY protein [Planctomycetaceae bacterium]
MNDPITFRVIGAAQKVHRALGPGFAERTYHVALCRELTLQDISFSQEFEYEVFYEGCLCGTYRCDLVVQNEVIVELKAVREMTIEHRVQTISYLKASGLSRALLLNFGVASLDVRRFINYKRSSKREQPLETESAESDTPAKFQPGVEEPVPPSDYSSPVSNLPVPVPVLNPLNPKNPRNPALPAPVPVPVPVLNPLNPENPRNPALPAPAPVPVPVSVSNPLNPKDPRNPALPDP